MYRITIVTAVVTMAICAVMQPLPVSHQTEQIDRISVDDFNKACEGRSKLADPTTVMPAKIFNAVLVVNTSTCIIGELIQLPEINPDGSQAITLPKGLKFYGMAYHYNHGQYRDSRVLYETATLPRKDGVAPRTYTITVKEQ